MKEKKETRKALTMEKKDTVLKKGISLGSLESISWNFFTKK